MPPVKLLRHRAQIVISGEAGFTAPHCEQITVRATLVQLTH
ncbi:MAG: hypothetical protein ACUVX8_14880 [Candidatus Zipacnadales bacterium]